MRIGFALPQVGSAVGPETLVTAAQRAEDLGFDSLWVLDRILWPVNPRAPYPIGDGSLPIKYKSVLDPPGDTDVRRGSHEPYRARDRCPQPSLVQSGLTGAPVEHARRVIFREIAGRIRHRMVAG